MLRNVIRNNLGAVITLAVALALALLLAYWPDSKFSSAEENDVTVTAAKDARIRQNGPNNNHGTDALLKADGDDPDGTGNDTRSVMEFDVSTVPSDATVYAAVLTIHSDNTTQNYRVHELLKEWNESEVTWNKATSSVNWSTAGAKGATDAATANAADIGPLEAPWQDNAVMLDSALVQKWVDNSADNHGLLIEGDTFSTSGLAMKSKEATGFPAPQLQVFYDDPVSASDTTAPTESIDSGPAEDSTVTSDDVTFGYSSNDGTATMYCDLEKQGETDPIGGDICASNSSQTYNNLPDGAYDFSSIAVDPSDNQSTGETRQFTVDVNDANRPSTSISSGPSGSSTQTYPYTAAFNFSGTHSSSASIASGADDANLYRYNATTYPPDGTPVYQTTDNRVYVTRAKYGTGDYITSVGLLRFDTSSIPDNATITGAHVDLNVSAKSSPDGRDLTADYFDWSGSNGAADYTDTAGTNAVSGTSIGSLNVGSNSLALSNLSNISKTAPTELRFHVSGGQPAGDNYVLFDSYETSGGVAPKIVVDYTVGDYECRMYGIPGDVLSEGLLKNWESCSSGKSYSDLYPGNYEFQVRGLDGSGNPDPTPATRSFTLQGEVASDIEGEALTLPSESTELAVVSDAGASGGQAMRFRGTSDFADSTVTFTNAGKIKFTAKGVNSGGSYPALNVYLDGDQINVDPLSINNSGYATFTTVEKIPDGTYELAIKSTNANGSGRDLFIDKLEFPGLGS